MKSLILFSILVSGALCGTLGSPDLTIGEGEETEELTWDGEEGLKSAGGFELSESEGGKIKKGGGKKNTVGIPTEEISEGAGQVEGAFETAKEALTEGLSGTTGGGEGSLDPLSAGTQHIANDFNTLQSLGSSSGLPTEGLSGGGRPTVGQGDSPFGGVGSGGSNPLSQATNAISSQGGGILDGAGAGFTKAANLGVGKDGVSASAVDQTYAGTLERNGRSAATSVADGAAGSAAAASAASTTGGNGGASSAAAAAANAGNGQAGINGAASSAAAASLEGLGGGGAGAVLESAYYGLGGGLGGVTGGLGGLGG